MMKKGWLSLLVSVLVMALALTMVGCGSTPSEASTDAAEAPAAVQDARDAAVTFVREHSEEALPESLSWAEEKLTPEGLVGGEEWQYTAGDWLVKVSYGVVAPEWTVYHVAVSNKITGFEWEGRVDGSGRAPEAPENVLLARDQVLFYITERYGLSGLGAGLAWQEEWAVGEGIVGAGGYRYSSGDWVVTVSYPVVAPESAIYTIAVTNQSTGFQWEGEVDAQGALTEHAAQAPVEMFDRVAARDAALGYVYEKYKYPPLDQSVEWQEERLTAEGIVGGETYQCTAGDWVVTVSYPVVLPENTVYTIAVTNESSGFEWEGQVDPQGVVTEG